jgi:hypothetical protein
MSGKRLQWTRHGPTSDPETKRRTNATTTSVARAWSARSDRRCLTAFPRAMQTTPRRHSYSFILNPSVFPFPVIEMRVDFLALTHALAHPSAHVLVVSFFLFLFFSILFYMK